MPLFTPILQIGITVVNNLFSIAAVLGFAFRLQGDTNLHVHVDRSSQNAPISYVVRNTAGDDDVISYR